MGEDRARVLAKPMKRRVFALTILAATVVLMIPFFRRGDSGSNGREFRERVLKIVRTTHPTMQFDAPVGAPDVIVAQGIEIGLQNLKAKFDLSDRSTDSFERLVTEHFQFALSAEAPVLDFEVAKPRLRPQIMPKEYATHVALISFPFATTLTAGIVLDSDKGYTYVTLDDAARWNKSKDELLDVAIVNLDVASRAMQLHISSGEDAQWVGVEVKDGFDAARILVPNFRAFLASRLGSPFRFAVPNRDFLICWSATASGKFTEFVVGKVQEDFRSQPYPLSQRTFEMAADGKITESK